MKNECTSVVAFADVFEGVLYSSSVGRDLDIEMAVVFCRQVGIVRHDLSVVE